MFNNVRTVNAQATFAGYQSST